jgi:hypothetical protein
LASLLNEIETLITDVAAGYGFVVRKAYMPAEPDKVVSLFEYPGMAPLVGSDMDRPHFQVRVRGDAWGYEEARALLAAVQGVLHGFTGEVGGVYYPGISALSSPLSLGFDQNNRPEIVQNYRAMRSRP